MARKPTRTAKPAPAASVTESEFYSDQSALGHAATNADEEMMTLQHAIRRWDDSPDARITTIARTNKASGPGWLITGQR